MTATDFVSVERGEGVLSLTLRRPDKRNALSTAMIDAMAGALAAADSDKDVRVIAIRGEGNDFCAGADLQELLESCDRTLAENEASAMRLGELLLGMRSAHQLTVAVVQGRALAGGAGLASACDIVLAREDAEFGYPEVSRGFVPAMVMTLLRQQVGERQALDLLLTGRTLSARDALAAGLVSRILPTTNWSEAAQSVLEELVALPVGAVTLTKQLFRQIEHLSVREGIALGAQVNALSRATPEFNHLVETFLGR